ncbi:MAG: hypothetical protein D8M58_09170 [Calditrichaeota bacterium]|nr:MAG: hypothetical protein DWQ03_17320 [Calditrichota bacterium]MBL1205556.1 hypothetical protein [Calditrichota bacterium]NOG45385.1 hypothetical protein [Calditrichota bacterium]
MVFQKCFKLSLLFFVLLSFGLHAQDSTSENSRTNKLQFYLVNGLDISYSDLSLSFPLRYNFFITGAYDNRDAQEKDMHIISDSNLYKQNYIFKGFNYKISSKILYINFLYETKSFKSYFGIGPIVSFKRSHANYISKYVGDNSFDSNKFENDVWSNSYEVGLSTLIGIEAKLIDLIALFAEYDLDFLYNFVERKVHNRDKSSTRKYLREEDNYQISLSNVKLGVSVFF